MSLLEFRSPAAGGFFMMPTTFKGVCEVLNRPYAESGCWMPEDLPSVIKALEEAIEREKAVLEEIKRRREERERKGGYLSFEEEEKAQLEEEKAKERVSFTVRVFPLMQMLQAARSKDKKVWWGVP
ncbi:MAG: DUF1840 family protein [Duodenibacillus sp.]